MDQNVGFRVQGSGFAVPRDIGGGPRDLLAGPRDLLLDPRDRLALLLALCLHSAQSLSSCRKTEALGLVLGFRVYGFGVQGLGFHLQASGRVRVEGSRLRRTPSSLKPGARSELRGGARRAKSHLDSEH